MCACIYTGTAMSLALLKKNSPAAPNFATHKRKSGKQQ